MGINRAPALGVPYGDLPWGPSHFSLSLAVSIAVFHGGVLFHIPDSQGHQEVYAEVFSCLL